MKLRKWTARPDMKSYIWESTYADAGETLFHDRELVEWCRQNGCEMHSHWISCKTDEAYLFFKMKFLCD